MKFCTQNQGITIWMTGLSGAGKTTLASALKSLLQDQYGRKVIILDGDKLRTGINMGLGFSRQDRSQNIRRVSEMAKMLNQEGLIVVTACISPYREDRDKARRLHQSNNLKYFEVFVNTSLQICEQRDTKGLYKKARQGLIPKFTGVSDPYEPSKDCQLQINSGIETVEESFAKLTNYLFKNYLFSQVDQVQLYQYVDYTCDIDDLNLLQVFLQKWTQVPSFMNYHQILESIYFKTYSIANQRYFQPIPLFTLVSKEFAEKSKNHSNIKVRFINPINKSTIAILQNPQFELFRFEEFSNKIFGISSQKHPKIEQLKNKGQYILSGEKLIFKCLRIFFNDGLDYLRKDVQQIKDIIKSVGADCVFGFQLRNPLHNGHLFLLQNARNSLIKKGYKKPMLLLHPCGGWVKEDDVPLSVRVKQHEQLLKNNDKFKDIVFELAIWPSPMYYAGPLQVLWHIKSREMLGINYMVVGRDPAGIKHPLNPSADLYDPFDGQRVIEIAIKLNYIKTQIIPFKVIAWNKVRKQLMEFNQESKQQFETISGSQMRKMAKNNEQVPEWFMGKSSWNILKSYYQVNA